MAVGGTRRCLPDSSRGRLLDLFHGGSMQGFLPLVFPLFCMYEDRAFRICSRGMSETCLGDRIAANQSLWLISPIRFSHTLIFPAELGGQFRAACGA